MTSSPWSPEHKTWQQARYERLLETIDEYIGGTGDDMGIEPFIRDLKKACIDVSAYHREVLDNCTTFADYLP